MINETYKSRRIRFSTELGHYWIALNIEGDEIKAGSSAVDNSAKRRTQERNLKEKPLKIKDKPSSGSGLEMVQRPETEKGMENTEGNRLLQSNQDNMNIRNIEEA